MAKARPYHPASEDAECSPGTSGSGGGPAASPVSAGQPRYRCCSNSFLPRTRHGTPVTWLRCLRRALPFCYARQARVVGPDGSSPYHGAGHSPDVSGGAASGAAGASPSGVQIGSNADGHAVNDGGAARRASPARRVLDAQAERVLSRGGEDGGRGAGAKRARVTAGATATGSGGGGKTSRLAKATAALRARPMVHSDDGQTPVNTPPHSGLAHATPPGDEPGELGLCAISQRWRPPQHGCARDRSDLGLRVGRCPCPARPGRRLP